MKMTYIVGAACIVLLTLGFSQSASAQTATASATAGASAKILAQLTITKNTDIAFGNLSGTTAGPVVLSPILANNANVGATTSVGRFTITGEGTNDVFIKWDATVTLGVSGNDEDDIPMTSIVHSTPADDRPTSGDALGVPDGTVVALVNGELTLWVGGSLPKLTNKPSGTYTGTFNVQVDYN